MAPGPFSFNLCAWSEKCYFKQHQGKITTWAGHNQDHIFEMASTRGRLICCSKTNKVSWSTLKTNTAVVVSRELSWTALHQIQGCFSCNWRCYQTPHKRWINKMNLLILIEFAGCQAGFHTTIQVFGINCHSCSKCLALGCIWWPNPGCPNPRMRARYGLW